MFLGFMVYFRSIYFGDLFGFALNYVHIVRLSSLRSHLCVLPSRSPIVIASLPLFFQPPPPALIRASP